MGPGSAVQFCRATRNERVLTGAVMKLHVFGGLAISALVITTPLSTAGAADIPLKAPPPASSYNWTGFYLGIEGGGGWGSTQHTNETTGISSGKSNNLDGGLIGGTYGYNWQFGQWVLGLESDISWSGIQDRFQDNGSGFCTGVLTCVTKLNWLGTDRARFGYASDKYLAYVTGGVAYGAVNATIVGNACCTNETHTEVGYAAGGGIEGKIIPNWSAKLEYIYVDLGSHHIYQNAVPHLEDVLVTSNTVRFGLNYHFH